MIFDESMSSEPTYLPEHFVEWDEITQVQIEDFHYCLNSASNERDMQAYLEKHSYFMIQHLGGGHGRWVIPNKRLGAEYVPDFVIGEKHSLGFEWQVVELESPKAVFFTKNGDPSKVLNHAIRQITDWRSWLKQNQGYASRPKEENGLGLIDIDSSVKGLIILGRRSDIDSTTNERRRQLGSNLNIDIHTYDWLVECAEGRLKALGK